MVNLLSNNIISDVQKNFLLKKTTISLHNSTYENINDLNPEVSEIFKSQINTLKNIDSESVINNRIETLIVA